LLNNFGTTRRAVARATGPALMAAFIICCGISARGQDETAWSASSAHNQLFRVVDHPMGDNNGVSLWVRGDGSEAAMRVRLMIVDPDKVTPDTVLERPMWISTPLKLHSDWTHIVLPRSKFTLHRLNDVSDAVDPNLPADAQGGTQAAPEQISFSDVNAIVLETDVPNNTTMAVDDINWVKVDDSGTINGTAAVDNFESGNLAAWIPLGDADDQKPLSYSLITKPAWVHDGKVALKISVVAPAARRKGILMSGVERQMAITQKSYLVFQPVSLFATVLPSTLPEPGGSSSAVSVVMCADQIQAATFCVYSRKALSNVHASLEDDLYGTGHILRKSNLDVNVVKVWQRLGDGLVRDPDQAGLNPELIVKDDRVALSGMSPDIPLSGPAATDIPADSTKQFWITVNAPRNTAADDYNGKIVLRSAGNAPISVPIDVKILPMRLMNPAKQYAIDLRSRLDPAPDTVPAADGSAFVTDFVSPDVLKEQLEDIVDHGVHYTSIHDPVSTLWDAYDDRVAAGFLPPFVYQGSSDPHDVESQRNDHHAGEFIYYEDPSNSGESKLATLAKNGLPTATYVDDSAEYDNLQDDLDTVIYNRDCDYSEQLIRTHGKRVSMKHDWWYWNATNDDPHANRYSAGFLLERSHLYGAFIPVYQLAFGTDPYDDSSPGAPDAYALYRPEMLTYPTAHGVIDTIQWEAVREGINDDRYLTTMYAALRECKDAHVAKKASDDAQAFITAFMDKPLALLSDADYEAARAKIAGYAVTLRTTVDAYNRAHGGG